MRLLPSQSYTLLERFGCYVKDVCDKCGQILGPVRYTRRGEAGEWCSSECRGDAERPVIRRGGRPRKYKTNAERQRVYRHSLSVTKPPRSFAETKDLQAQKLPLSHTPLCIRETLSDCFGFAGFSTLRGLTLSCRMTRRLLGSGSMNRSVRGPTAGRMFFFWVVGIADHISAVSLILPSEQTELLSLLTEKVAMPAQRKRSLLRCQPATVIR